MIASGAASYSHVLLCVVIAFLVGFCAWVVTHGVLIAVSHGAKAPNVDAKLPYAVGLVVGGLFALFCIL